MDNMTLNAFAPNVGLPGIDAMDTMDEYEDDDVIGDLPHGAAGLYGSAGSMQNGAGSNSKQVRRRSSKACDQCRKSKCKCERTSPNEPCRSCVMLGTQCTFLGPSRKRGPPKGYIDAIESRLHQTEALLGVILALAYEEDPVVSSADSTNSSNGGDVHRVDNGALRLIEDLRSSDELAREIIERVDKGAYGLRGRGKRGVGGAPGKNEDGTVHGSAPANVQGRGRMVGLGQEIEHSALLSTHPSNEWQDVVAARLRSTNRSRSQQASPFMSNQTTSKAPLSIYPPAVGQSNSVGAPTSALSSRSLERDRQRRRLDRSVDSRSPEPTSPLAYPPQQLHTRASVGAFPVSANQTRLSTQNTGYRGSPPLAYASSSASRYNYVPPPQPGSAQGTEFDRGGSEQGLLSPLGGHYQTEPDLDSDTDNEQLTGAVGQLSLNEDEEVRYHGKASGLHLLANVGNGTTQRQRSQGDGRKEGGIWHFPKARVWPPVADRRRKGSVADERSRSPVVAKTNSIGTMDNPEEQGPETLLDLHITVQELEERARARLPDRDVQRQLLALYFTFVHPYLPIIHKKDFFRKYEAMYTGERYGSPSSTLSVPQGTSPIAKTITFDGTASPASSVRTSGSPAPHRERGVSTLLLLTMFAIAARYAPVTSGIVADSELPAAGSGEMWAAGDSYLEDAKVLLDRTYASSKPSICQALLLMGYREIGIGAMAQSWLYVGMAIRTAQDLGMHRMSDRWERKDGPLFTAVQQQVRKRIWYACVVMDKYVSTYIGRPISIFEHDYDTQLPSVEEEEEMQLWSPRLPDGMFAADEKTPDIPYSPVPGHVISCFSECARLSSIVSVVVQSIYAVRPVIDRHAQASDLEMKLSKWYLDLPPHLQYEPSSKKVPPPHVLTLHMQYWCAVLLLHRPFIRHYLSNRYKLSHRGDTPPSHAEMVATSQQDYDLCVSAANHITHIVSSFMESFDLQRAPVFLSYYLFTASIMHVTTLAADPSDPQAATGLEKCMNALKRMETIWSSAKRAWDLLNGAKADLLDVAQPVSDPSYAERPYRKRSVADILDTPQDSEPGDADMLGRQNPAQQRYTPGFQAQPGLDVDSPLSFLDSYDRWTPGDAMVFPPGLSTSVLPPQYSTGFVDDRSSASRPQSNVMDNNARYPQYWSEYSTVSQPPSMLGSIYGMSIMPPQSTGQQSAQSGSQQQQPMYMNNQFDMFGTLPPA